MNSNFDLLSFCVACVANCSIKGKSVKKKLNWAVLRFRNFSWTTFFNIFSVV